MWGKSRPAAALRAAALLAALLAGCGGDEPGAPGTPSGEHVVVGAHYYIWYDGEHRHWETRWRGPLLGHYSSGDPAVAAQHVEWASAAGIDVLAVDWFDPTWSEQHLRSGLLSAPNLDEIRWCLFYDIANRMPAFGHDDPFHIPFGNEALARGFVEDLARLAAEYFSHPQYFRIDGRPVLWLYLTRNYEGPWLEAVDELRRRTAAQGHPVYLVADEVWYAEPDLERARAFDALTTYNLYDPLIMRERTSWSLPEYFAIYQPVFEHWRARTAGVTSRAHGRRVPFLPAVLPQYDDSAAKGGLNPPVLAASRQPIREVLRAAREMALANAEPEERVVWLTSFNEWHEGTAFEPTAPGTPEFPNGHPGMALLELASEAFGGTLH